MPRTDLVIDGCRGNRIWVEAGEVTAESGLVPKLFIPAKLDLCPVNNVLLLFLMLNVACFYRTNLSKLQMEYPSLHPIQFSALLILFPVP